MPYSSVLTGLRIFSFLLLLVPSAGPASTEDPLPGAAGLAVALLQREVVSALGPPPRVGAGRPAAPEQDRGSQPFYVHQIGARFVQLGLAYRDDNLRAAGWRRLRAGFGAQRSDGSFETPRAAVLGTAFFVGAAARAILLDRQVGLQDGEALVEPTLRAARWLAAHDPATDREMRAFRRYTHRYWVTANALCFAGTLAGDAALVRRAAEFARLGLAAQRADGVNPEGGGFDVGYQSTGLTHAAQYLRVCAGGTERAEVAAAVSRGLEWLSQRVGPDGALDVTGSTRILREPGRDGSPKNIPYRSIAEAFAWGKAATGRAEFGATVDRIIGNPAFIRSVGGVRAPEYLD